MAADGRFMLLCAINIYTMLTAAVSQISNCWPDLLYACKHAHTLSFHVVSHRVFQLIKHPPD